MAADSLTLIWAYPTWLNFHALEAQVGFGRFRNFEDGFVGHLFPGGAAYLGVERAVIGAGAHHDGHRDRMAQNQGLLFRI